VPFYNHRLFTASSPPGTAGLSTPYPALNSVPKLQVFTRDILPGLDFPEMEHIQPLRAQYTIKGTVAWICTSGASRCVSDEMWGSKLGDVGGSNAGYDRRYGAP
jgi:hypothetical protein